jgi:uncharacterized membrane protein
MSEQPPPPPPGDSGSSQGGPPSPPPEGSYEPPPPYGQPPPYGGAGQAPPPPGGGFAPPGEGPYNATDAFGYGWNKFKARPSEMLVPVLVVFLVVIVVEAIVQVLLATTLLATRDCTTTVGGQSVRAVCGPNPFVRLLATALAGLVVSLIVQSLGAGLIKNALNVADGRPASINQVFTWAVKPQVIGTAALIALITFVGTLLCYLPGLIAAFLLNWSMFYVVDKNLSPVDAIKASFSFTTGHLGATLVFYLLGVVAFIVGALLCLVGLLVAAPVVLIGAAYTFRRLLDEPVTPAP